MEKITFSPLAKSDIDEIVSAFTMIGWNKPHSIYEAYLLEQANVVRSVIVAKEDGQFCGYVTIKWKSDYNAFTKQNIPEIADLNVLPNYRNQGIGTALIYACESIVKERGYQKIGLGVGMTADYGNAQRLYVQLDYMPDGNGLHYKYNSLQYGNQTTVDDDLVLFFTKSLSTTDYQRIDLPTHIETPRLLLRPPRASEGKLLNTAILESFQLLNKYMAWAKEKPSLEESEFVVKREAQNWILKKKSDPELMLLILDKKTNDLIGATGFHGIDWNVPCAETGYWVRKKYTGQGYITEALNAITQYAFNAMKVKRLAITCDIDNERSKKVPERLKFHLESTMKANRIKPVTGEITDTLVFVRTNLTDLPAVDVIWRD